MTISVNQQVDFLWKKLGYNVAKTDVPTLKDATNESISSTPFIPGDKIWTQSDLIPPVLPAATTPIVQVYNGTTAVACTMDNTATTNRTWLTGLTDWVPTTFGSTYQIRVFLDNVGAPNPMLSGQQLYAMGSNANDEWYFDHESGVLNFIGDNLPALNFAGKTIYVCGGRYAGYKGVNALAAGTFGNITISGDTISSTGNLLFSVNGNINAGGSTITNLGTPSAPTDAATVQYVLTAMGSIQANAITQGDSSIAIADTGALSTATIKLNNQTVSTFTPTSATIQGVSFTGSTISSTLGDLVLAAPAGQSITTTATTAMQVPTGSTLDRPASPAQGFVRFNSSSGTLEVYDGANWINALAQIAFQTIYGDGLSATFPLDRPDYADAVAQD